MDIAQRKDLFKKYQWPILLINTLPITALLLLGLFTYLKLDHKNFYDMCYILKSAWGFFVIIGINFSEDPLFSILSISGLFFILLTNIIQFYFSSNKLVKIIVVIMFIFILVTMCYSFYSEYLYTTTYS